MRVGLYATAVILLLQSPVGAVTIGQIQTFDDPNHHWMQGGGPGGVSPITLPLELGGPGGPSDPYLEVESTGTGGPGSHISAQNFVEWSGDYIAAGVNRIRMDVRNFSTANDLFLRLLFVDFGAMGPANAAMTTAVRVPSGSGWQSIEFDIAPSALLTQIGSATTALANTDEFRIVHNPGDLFIPTQNPPIAATLGVDNINAVVPEPSTTILLLSGLAAAYGFRNSSMLRARRVNRDRRIAPLK